MQRFGSPIAVETDLLVALTALICSSLFLDD